MRDMLYVNDDDDTAAMNPDIPEIENAALSLLYAIRVPDHSKNIRMGDSPPSHPPKCVLPEDVALSHREMIP